MLEWYDIHRRKLPWRGSRDPYVIWVSEIIFQQTRIEQGTGYYLRFIARFPDVASLAAAAEDEVLRLWQGLGYYSRARNLHRMARWICDQLGGSLPETYEGLLGLKGVGDYTASCIASICFGQPHAALDGNVYRVLSRYFGDTTPTTTASGKKHFKKLAQGLIDSGRPGDFNEAMMDLGAMICTPRSPSCNACPVSAGCSALKMGLVEALPVKSREQAKSRRVFNYLWLWADGKVAIRKRAGKDIWEGLYELPMIEGDLEPHFLPGKWLAVDGLDVGEVVEVKRVRHVLSHQVIEIRFFQPASPDRILVAVQRDLLIAQAGELNRYPFPKPLAGFLNDKIEGYGSGL